mgnify:CR=1 FL=1
MDVIEKIIAGHIEVQEKTDFLRKFTELHAGGDIYRQNLIILSKFLCQDIRQHFQLEEKVLFPIIKQTIPVEENKKLAEIITEHQPILQLLTNLEYLLEQATHSEQKNLPAGLNLANQTVVDLLIPHADREDKQIFPLIKRYFRANHYQELEAKYFDFITHKS